MSVFQKNRVEKVCGSRNKNGGNSCRLVKKIHRIFKRLVDQKEELSEIVTYFNRVG
jgi:hypothetical protein